MVGVRESVIWQALASGWDYRVDCIREEGHRCWGWIRIEEGWMGIEGIEDWMGIESWMGIEEGRADRELGMVVVGT